MKILKVANYQVLEKETTMVTYIINYSNGTSTTITVKASDVAELELALSQRDCDYTTAA